MTRKRPTDKQLRYLQDLLGKGRTEAYRAIREAGRRGTVERRPTIWDAGRAIEKAKRDRS